MDTKCKIVPLDMVGRTENGTVYFSADEITVFFQFIGANSYHKDLPVGIATVRNHNTATTIPNPCLHYLSGMRWDKAGVFFIL